MERLRYSEWGELAMRAEPVITRLMSDALAQPDLLSLAAGFTDNRVLPAELVKRLVSDLASQAGEPAYLQYGMNQGRPGLREAVIALLKSYPGESALPLSVEDVLISNGSQQSLYISAQLFCNPGDVVLVERPSYFVFLELLKGLGLKPVSIPVHFDGRIDIEGLESLFDEWRRSGDMDRLKMIYIMGAFANPSTRCVEEACKRKLARVLKQNSRPIPIIEDMAYRELYFEEPYPARSMLSLEEFEDYPLLYAGTFTKPFATGLKIGFVASRCKEWLRGIGRIKGHQDFGSANFNQAIIEEAWNSGDYDKHLKSVRGHYKRKMEILQETLTSSELPEVGWNWEEPQGGLLMWLRGPKSVDTKIGSPFHKACIENQVLYVPGDLCYAEDPENNTVRLSFGALPEERLPEAAQRFARSAVK